MHIVHRKSQILGQLPLHADAALHHGWGLDVSIEFPDGLRSAAAQEIADRWNGGIEVGSVHDELLLLNTVTAQRIERETLADAVVEESSSSAQNRLSCLAMRSQSPGKANARREIAMVVDSALAFVAKSEAQRHVGADPPIVESK